MSKQEVVFIKQEHNKTAIDVTNIDSDSDIEPEVERIADTISSNINLALKNTLQPFITQYNSRRHQHKVISGVLKQLPEFQKLVTENAELKLELNNIQKSSHTKNEITLEVKEKQQIHETTEEISCDTIMKTVNLEKHTNNTITNSDKITGKNIELIESFYKAIECSDNESNSDEVMDSESNGDEDTSVDWNEFNKRAVAEAEAEAAPPATGDSEFDYKMKLWMESAASDTEAALGAEAAREKWRRIGRGSRQTRLVAAKRQ